MQTRQGNMLQALQSVEAFLDENADALPGVVQTGAKQKLQATISLLTTHVSEQTGSFLASKGATRTQKALRKALLRDHMQPIARIAQAELPPTPAVEPLRLPKGKPTLQRLSAAALGMAKAAEPFAATFVASGMPTDFAARLTTAAEALLASGDERVQNRGKWSGATTGLKVALASGRRIVHVLDAFVQSALTGNDALLANWKVVKRIHHISPRAAAAPVPGTPSASTSPTSSASPSASAPTPASAGTPTPAPVSTSAPAAGTQH